MNHHLRFATVPSCPCVGILGALAIGLLSSCTRVGQPPAPLSKRPAAANPDEVTITTHFFTVPDGYLPNGAPDRPMSTSIVSTEEGERILGRLQRKRGAKPVAIPVAALKRKAGASKSIKLTREHIYPTEYKPAVIPENADDIKATKGTFPVTPATPTAFETKDLGITINYGIHSFSGNSLVLDWKFQRTAFIGDVNYGKPITTTGTNFFGRPVEVVITENIMAMAVFSTAAANSQFTIQGDCSLIFTGRKRPGPPSKDASFIPAPPQPPASANSDWIVLIQVKTGSPVSGD